jgi:hypothetical protein
MAKRKPFPKLFLPGIIGRFVIDQKRNRREAGGEPASAECYCTKLKCDRKRLIIKEILVEAAGVEPASENVTGQENYMLSRVHALGITPGRSRRALRTDKKRDPLACDLSLASQT